tara:strand:+ start:211 stop:321 length:111 start_codon:yes stop_codon:yes gene_type:complete
VNLLSNAWKDQERWAQEHREELERDTQELFDQLFGG